jgi:hypothetical protein
MPLPYLPKLARSPVAVTVPHKSKVSLIMLKVQTTRRRILKWGRTAAAGVAASGVWLPNFGISSALAADLGGGDICVQTTPALERLCHVRLPRANCESQYVRLRLLRSRFSMR